MKAVFALIVVSLAGQLTWADDTGFMAISVKDLQFNTSTWEMGGKNTRTPISVEEKQYVVDANGNEAAKLMAMLPSESSVLEAMYEKDQQWVKTYRANFKTLAITGANNQPWVLVSCQGGKLDTDHMQEGQPPKFTAYTDGTHCQIQVGKGEIGDAQYNFDPRKAICSGN